MENIPASMNIAGWLVAAFFILKIWNEAHKALDRQKEQPAPAQTYATKAEVAEVRKDLREYQVEESKGASNRRTMIYNKIDVTAKETDRKIEAVHQRIEATRHELDEKLDAMPERVIAILRNTGALKS